MFTPAPRCCASLLLLVTLALCACGGDKAAPDAGVQPDSTTRAPDSEQGAPKASGCPGDALVCATRAAKTTGGEPWHQGPLVSYGEHADDVVLANGLARYVIRGGSVGAAMYGTTGGHLVDVGNTGDAPPVDALREHVLTVGMHLVRPDEVRIVDTGDPKVAEVEVRGALVSFPTLDEALGLDKPPVTVRHTYRLRAGSPVLELTTHLSPTPAYSAGDTVLVADVMFWGGEVALYLPGHGDQVLPTTAQTEVMGFVRRRSRSNPWAPDYACALRADQPMSSIDAGAIKAFLLGNRPVAAAGTSVTRYLACDRSLAAAMHAVAQAAGAAEPDTREVDVTVPPGFPADDTVVDLLDKEGKPLTRCGQPVDGRVTCVGPSATASARAGWIGDGGEGLASGGQIAVSDDLLAAGQTPTTQGQPGRLLVSARRGGKPVPVRVTLRSKTAPDDKGRRRHFAQLQAERTYRLPADTWEVWVSAGPLSARHSGTVVVKAGETTELEVDLPEVVDPGPWRGLDSHVHSEPSSDSQVPVARRLAGAIAEGLSAVILTDHDIQTDPSRWIGGPLAAGQGACLAVRDHPILAFTGAEVSTLKTGHFNVWPLTPGPSSAVAWYELGASALLDAVAGGAPGKRMVQCNHPHFEAFSFFKAIGFNASTTPPELLRCDLLEVINGIDHKATPKVLADWLGLLARGIRITAVGTSDCHGVSDFVGNPRTWVRLAPGVDLCTQPTALDEALRAGRAVASAGPLLTVTVKRGAAEAAIGDTLATGADPAIAHVALKAPGWMPLGTVELYYGTQKLKSVDVSGVESAAGAKAWSLELPLAATASDTTVVAVHLPKGTAWPMLHRPPWAVTNPVLIDGDGDGAWFGP